MMLRYTFNQEAAAKAIEEAVGKVLDQGLRTPDIWTEGTQKVGTAKWVMQWLRRFNFITLSLTSP
jgi:isocitrate/isopropylmalate dehydrogenase